MKKNIFTILLAWCASPLLIMAQSQEKVLTVEVTNNWTKNKTEVPVVIQLDKTGAKFQVQSATVLEEGTKEVAYQLDDLNNDQQVDELVFLANLSANETKTFRIVLSPAKSSKQFEPRVFAEMLISDKRGKHVPIQSLTIPGSSNVYNQLHHHGPAFESELVAYRLYFDQKQTIDIYGKFNKGFEIEECQFYPSDEQLARGFGDDVLRVGGSCGVGALKGWNGEKATHIEPVKTLTERIVAYGPIRTIVESEVKGWEYQGSVLNMTNRYTLYGGHRDLLIETFFEEPLKGEIFCTGVQDVKGSSSYSDHKGLIGCWGTDWPVNDTVKYAKETVGLATYIPQKYVVKEVKDKPNYLYTVTSKGNKYFHHYSTFTSMKETFGYKKPEDWFAFIREWKEDLENPVTIKIKK
ncbi:MAG: DUF4861 domain-containing protein [Bacteroides sp.]|nr:DUF4861 domain-containing protein [Bacteroides sp.]